MPIGNVTSQIFANIYLNELDQFIKHQLKIKYYFRYADDFVVVHEDAECLKDILINVDCFLRHELSLQLHPNKVEIRKLRRGIDFLGYVALPYYSLLRIKTKKRMMKKLAGKKKLLLTGKLDEEKYCQSLRSYLGMLKHCRGHKIEQKVKDLYGF